jgi:hypothetical protein
MLLKDFVDAGKRLLRVLPHSVPHRAPLRVCAMRAPACASPVRIRQDSGWDQ